MFPSEGGKVKIPAAWLIEQAGFQKGYAIGAAGISSRHTLALVDRGGATAAEILALAEQIANAAVEECEFGIRAGDGAGDGRILGAFKRSKMRSRSAARTSAAGPSAVSHFAQEQNFGAHG